MEQIHIDAIGFNLYLINELIRVQKDGAKISFGNMVDGKIIPAENDGTWDVVKAKYPDEKGFRYRTLEQLKQDYKELLKN
jgi:hypothetical protein